MTADARYCEECDEFRVASIKFCPKCSNTYPRYILKFRSSLGMNRIHDRWTSRDLEVFEIVELIKTLEAQLSEADAVIKPFADRQIQLEKHETGSSVVPFGKEYRAAAEYIRKRGGSR